MLLLGNVDKRPVGRRVQGPAELALLECLTGQSWSLETWGGWTQMMSRYLGVTANLAPAAGGGVLVLRRVRTDYAMFRYSLASALMGDGYFAYNGNGSYSSTSWYDEFNVNLGAALQPAVTVAYQNGVYRRDFQNGIVLVNPRWQRHADGHAGWQRSTESSARRIQPPTTVRRSPRSTLNQRTA